MALKLNKKNIVILLLGLSVLIGLLFTFKSNNNSYKPEYDTEARIVKNFNDFYTISNCINKYISYLNTKNAEGAFSVLTNIYKKKNNISKENVIQKLNIEENTAFIAKKMLYKYIADNEYKYYIYGIQEKNNVTMDTIFDETNAKDTYYIVYVKNTEKANIFSIEPYDGKEFLNGVGV